MRTFYMTSYCVWFRNYLKRNGTRIANNHSCDSDSRTMTQCQWHFYSDNVTYLHLYNKTENQVNALNEKGEMFNGRGDKANVHDILTGSQDGGTALFQTTISFYRSLHRYRFTGHLKTVFNVRAQQTNLPSHACVRILEPKKRILCVSN